MEIPAEAIDEVRPPTIRSRLYSVKVTPPKPWKKKAAPQPPPRFYRIDPRGFRRLVQALTGKPKERRLQTMYDTFPSVPAPQPLAELPWSPPRQLDSSHW